MFILISHTFCESLVKICATKRKCHSFLKSKLNKITNCKVFVDRPESFKEFYTLFKDTKKILSYKKFNIFSFTPKSFFRLHFSKSLKSLRSFWQLKLIQLTTYIVGCRCLVNGYTTRNSKIHEKRMEKFY